MSYVFYGSLAILMWKCGTQLMSEIKYKPIQEEEDILAKAKLRKGHHMRVMKKWINLGGRHYVNSCNYVIFLS